MDPELPITVINQASAWSGWLPAATGIVGTALGGVIAARTSKGAAQRQWASESYEHTRKYFGELLIATDSLRINLSNTVTKYEDERAKAVKATVKNEAAGKGVRVDFRVEQTPEELTRNGETLKEFRKVLSRVGLYGGQDLHDKIFAVDSTRAAIVGELNQGYIDAARRELEIFELEVQILRRGTQRDVGIRSLVVLNNLAPWKDRKTQRVQTLATIAEIDRLDGEDLQKIKVLRAKSKDTSPVKVEGFGVERMQ